MPTYEYQCLACGYKFEIFHSIVAEPVRVCPKCSAQQVDRLINGGSGVIFKGSGFYLTDYKNKNSSPAATKTEPKKTEEKKSD